MDLNIILIVLIALILIALVAHGLWSNHRDKSQLFKNASKFTYDARVQTNDFFNNENDHVISAEQLSTPPKPEQPELDIDLKESTNTVASAQQTMEPARDIKKIRITLPSKTQGTESARERQSTPTLSQETLLQRTIAELENEVDEVEGINTSSSLLREALAQQTTLNSNPSTLAVKQETKMSVSPSETIDADSNAKPITSETSTREKESVQPTTIMLYVAAKANRTFNGTSINSALENLGFIFGEHNFFHRHFDIHDAQSPVIFSIANMMKPGYFDPVELPMLKTVGLVLFMRLPTHGNDLANLRLLLRGAQTLAEQLDGILLDDKRQTFTEASKDYYLNLIN